MASQVAVAAHLPALTHAVCVEDSATDLSKSCQEDEDWLPTYLASTCYGKDPRLSSAVCRLAAGLGGGVSTFAPSRASAASDNKLNLDAGGATTPRRVSLPSRTTWHGTTAAATAAVTAVTNSNRSEDFKLGMRPDLSASLQAPSTTVTSTGESAPSVIAGADSKLKSSCDDSSELEGNTVATLKFHGAAPLCSLAQRGGDSEASAITKTSINTISRKSDAIRPGGIFRALRPASIGNAADLSLPRSVRQSLSHSDAGDREEESSSEDFHSWVATSQCRTERSRGGSAARKAAGKASGKAAQPAGPWSPLTAGTATAAAAIAAAAPAAAQQEDEKLGTGSVGGCGTATTATANATGRSSVSLSTSGRRMSINRRRNAMDYSELDAVRERLKQAAGMWAIAAPDCEKDDDDADSLSSDTSNDTDDAGEASSDGCKERGGTPDSSRHASRALWGSSSEEASSTSGAGTSGEGSPAEQMLICERAGHRKSTDQQQQQKEQQQQHQGMGMTQRRSASALWQLLLPGARR
ncbi:unnamed protein product [Closterium sp. NIES-53]